MRQIYRVSFFKKLVDSYGHPVDACQSVIEVRAVGQEQAIEQARLNFAKTKGVSDWSFYADYETVEMLSASERALRSAWAKVL